MTVLLSALLLALDAPQTYAAGTWGEPVDYPQAIRPAIQAYVSCLATEWDKHLPQHESPTRFDEAVAACNPKRAERFSEAERLLSASDPRGSPRQHAAAIEAAFDAAERQYRYHIWSVYEALQRVPRKGPE